MQRLSMIAFMAFAVVALSGAGFTKMSAPASSLASATTAALSSPMAKSFVPSYYWYSAFDGSYNDYETLAWEEWEMEVDYDVLVNTDPAGGTLVEEGYWFEDPDYPASYLLYAHF